jgi:hypothetical protein
VLTWLLACADPIVPPAPAPAPEAPTAPEPPPPVAVEPPPPPEPPPPARRPPARCRRPTSGPGTTTPRGSRGSRVSPARSAAPDPAEADAAFFPLSAYLQVKELPPPTKLDRDWRERLLAGYRADLAALRGPGGGAPHERAVRHRPPSACGG